MSAVIWSDGRLLRAYRAGIARAYRHGWMTMAREAQFPETKSERVKHARECNRELLGHFRALREMQT